LPDDGVTTIGGASIADTAAAGEVAARVMTPPSKWRTEMPGLRCATRLASVVMPRIWATAAPRPARHFRISYSKASIDGGRSSGLRAIARITSSLTASGIDDRSCIGGTGSRVAFLVRISMKLSPW
jgi:hypothetical protein